MVKNALTPKYIILDETVIKRRGNRIEYLGKLYSTTERRIVTGISLLSSMLWINRELYFPLFSSLRTKENLTKQFVELLKRIPFRNTILLMDGGILCSELFFEAVKSGYGVIGRSNSRYGCYHQWCKATSCIIEETNKRNNFCCGNYPKIQQCESQACFSQHTTGG